MRVGVLSTRDPGRGNPIRSFAISKKGGASAFAPPYNAERAFGRARVLAHRYLGPEAGDRYMESTVDDRADDAMILIHMRPERWLTADYSKEDVGL